MKHKNKKTAKFLDDLNHSEILAYPFANFYVKFNVEDLKYLLSEKTFTLFCNVFDNESINTAINYFDIETYKQIPYEICK